jgi:ABC-type Mn2+/Zn2+ transport system ATPase subunit
MNVMIQKLNGLWHFIVGACQIRTAFVETEDRALVVTYVPGREDNRTRLTIRVASFASVAAAAHIGCIGKRTPNQRTPPERIRHTVALGSRAHGSSAISGN